MDNLIHSIYSLESIDFKILGLNYDNSAESRAETMFDFLSGEMGKSFGQGVLSVSTDMVRIGWIPSVANKKRDTAQNIYFAHLIQAGMLKDPTPIIANLAYNGGIQNLNYVVLAIHTYSLNPAIAKKSSTLLALSAPYNASAWFTSGIIDLDQGFTEFAQQKFEHILTFSSWDYLTMKHLAICELRNNRPKEAVRWMEKSLDAAASVGIVPGLVEFVSYGMALRSQGLHDLAKQQFKAAGVLSPKMTTAQWCWWGYKLFPDVLPESLANPSRGLYITKWVERGEDGPSG